MMAAAQPRITAGGPQVTPHKRLTIGGSDAAAVLGISPWQSQVQLYLRLIDQLPPEDMADKPWLEWGNLLEPVVAKVYERITGNPTRRVPRQLYHREHPFLTGHIDRQIYVQRRIRSKRSPRGVLEIKTALYDDEEWGPEFTDQVPQHYLVQPLHYMAVGGFDYAHLVVLFLAKRETRIYQIERDEEMIRGLVDTEVEFWHQHVMRHVPPAPRSIEDVNRLFKRDTVASVQAHSETENAVQTLRDIKREIGVLVEEQERLEIQIKKAMGNAGQLVNAVGDPLATWKAHNQAGLDTQRLRREQADIYRQYTIHRAVRPFRLKKQKGADK